MRCDAMLCCWFAVGLIEEELVEKGREEMAEHRERRKGEHRVLENFYYVFFICFLFLFFNIVLMWKFVGALKASVLYVYIDNSFHYDSCHYDFINFDEANLLDSDDKFLA